MAIITLTVQNADVQTILDAFKYDPSTGETSAVFMKRKIVEIVKLQVSNYLREQAINQARQSAIVVPDIT